MTAATYLLPLGAARDLLRAVAESRTCTIGRQMAADRRGIQAGWPVVCPAGRPLVSRHTKGAPVCASPPARTQIGAAPGSRAIASAQLAHCCRTAEATQPLIIRRLAIMDFLSNCIGLSSWRRGSERAGGRAIGRPRGRLRREPFEPAAFSFVISRGRCT